MDESARTLEIGDFWANSLRQKKAENTIRTENKLDKDSAQAEIKKELTARN